MNDSARRKSGPRKSSAGRLGDSEYRALGHFRHAMRQFLAFSEASARQEGLTSQQHQALLAIRSHVGDEPMSVGELADCLIVKNHTAVELVTRLVARGLVARAASAIDRRRVVLRLESLGEELLEAISVRNFGQLGRTSDILFELLDTVRRLQDGRLE